MSPITKTILALGLVLLAAMYLLTISGCGDANSRSTFDPDTGQHPPGWVITGPAAPITFPSEPAAASSIHSGHAVAALAHLGDCTECHAADLSGGIAKLPCSQCHLGVGVVGNQLTVDVHPLHWGTLAYALHGPFVDQNGAGACANAFCHGTNLQGATGPSCTACHLGGPFHVHPPEWDVQLALHGGYVLQHGTSACRNVTCHGAQLQGVFLSGPACSECHNGTVFP